MFQFVKRFVASVLSGKVSYKLAKHLSSPTNFQECADRPERLRSSWKRILFICLAPVIFYLLLHSQANKFYVGNKLDGFTESGFITANHTNLTLEDVEKKYPEVSLGGTYIPPNCTVRDRVAIIVPYRDRKQNLIVFLNHIHPFLMEQQIEYRIFIIEQEGTDRFNRGKLLNVGFVEAHRINPGRWQCFVFHDIDLLPLDTRNRYTCPRQPRHMSANVDKLGLGLLYDSIFGGVTAMTVEQFKKVNGFPNRYWGWGGEDDDMFIRLRMKNFFVGRYKMSIARYTMLKHNASEANPDRHKLLERALKYFKRDGLSNLVYDFARVTQYHLYTHVLVDIGD